MRCSRRHAAAMSAIALEQRGMSSHAAAWRGHSTWPGHSMAQRRMSSPWHTLCSMGPKGMENGVQSTGYMRGTLTWGPCGTWKVLGAGYGGAWVARPSGAGAAASRQGAPHCWAPEPEGTSPCGGGGCNATNPAGCLGVGIADPAAADAPMVSPPRWGTSAGERSIPSPSGVAPAPALLPCGLPMAAPCPMIGSGRPQAEVLKAPWLSSTATAPPGGPTPPGVRLPRLPQGCGPIWLIVTSGKPLSALGWDPNIVSPLIRSVVPAAELADGL